MPTYKVSNCLKFAASLKLLRKQIDPTTRRVFQLLLTQFHKSQRSHPFRSSPLLNEKRKKKQRKKKQHPRFACISPECRRGRQKKTRTPFLHYDCASASPSPRHRVELHHSQDFPDPYSIRPPLSVRHMEFQRHVAQRPRKYDIL